MPQLRHRLFPKTSKFYPRCLVSCRLRAPRQLLQRFESTACHVLLLWRAASKKQSSAPSRESCNNWNRPNGCTYREKYGVDCPRHHICNICFKEDNKSPECPSKRMKV